MHGSGCGCIYVICMPKEGLGKCGATEGSYTSINILCESLLCDKPNESVFHKRTENYSFKEQNEI